MEEEDECVEIGILAKYWQNLRVGLYSSRLRTAMISRPETAATLGINVCTRNLRRNNVHCLVITCKAKQKERKVANIHEIIAS